MFPEREDRLRAIDLLAEAGETYHGVPIHCYVISDAAAKLLEDKGVHFKVVGDKDRGTVRAASS
jgi:hypothetical protein